MSGAVASFPGVRSALPATTRARRVLRPAHGVDRAPAPARARHSGRTTGAPTRASSGSSSGRPRASCIAQQTGREPRCGLGDTITLERAPLAPVRLRVDGVIDFTAPQQLLGPWERRRGCVHSHRPTTSSFSPRLAGTALRRPGARTARARTPPGARRTHARHAPARPHERVRSSAGPRQNLETRLAGTGRRRQQPCGSPGHRARRQPLRTRRVSLPGSPRRSCWPRS